MPVIHEPSAKHSRPSMARVHSELLPSPTPSRTPSPNLGSFMRHHRQPAPRPPQGLSPFESSGSLHNQFSDSGSLSHSHSQYSTPTDLRPDSVCSFPASSPVMAPNVLAAVDARLRESSRQRAIASQSSSSSLRPPRHQNGSGPNSSRASSVAPVITHQSVLQSSDAIISREQLYDILNRDEDDDEYDGSEQAARSGGPSSLNNSQTRLGRPRPGFASSNRHSSQSSRRNSNSSSSLASGSGIELTSRGQYSSASASTLARPAMAREGSSRMSRHRDLSSTTMASAGRNHHHHHDNYSSLDLDTSTTEKSDWLRRKTRTSRKWRGICCGVGILAFIAIITGIVLGFVTRRGKVDGLATPPDPEKPTTNKPMPPITQFTPNPNLHKAFYGIDYNPAKALMPWCGVTLQNVVDDMILMSQLTNRIRLYGMDCAQADLTFQAISALNLNNTMKVVLTLWVDQDRVTYQRQYDTLLRVLDTYGTDMVQGISVGNEVLFRGDMSLGSLGELMKTVRTTVKTRYNKSVPVFTSEIGNNLNASLAAISDELSGNFHPYFAGTGVDEAAQWTMLQYNNTMEKNPTSTGLKGAISEVGWPSAPATAVYQTYAVPGLANLQTMIDTFICQANAAAIPYYWFEFQDAAWKNDPKVPVEPYWGIFDKDKRLKFNVPTCIAP
ncbi:hypothetical protein BGZ72_009320 [Mortierella alpina]|nr:hypothetical protein BGZ72_009320 [Mortierella alpina]